jgi:Fe-S cluster assembly protein SufB
MGALDYIQDLDRSVFDKANQQAYAKKAQKGLSEDLVRRISSEKKEPKWMLQLRLEALKKFNKMELPSWGVDLSDLDFDDLIYYASPEEMKGYATSWEDVPEDIKQTFERLGIPEAERKVLAGAGAQYDSLNAYHSLKKEWESKGVIFEDMDIAVQKHPDLVKQYFMKAVPITDHKFAALHAAVWSGGTFLYIPRGVYVDQPLQAYFRMNAQNMGQFEHTLIIVDEEAEGHYVEGCSAPKYGSTSLHAGCVEIYVKPKARFRYSSVENWSQDTYNLNTKRAIVDENGVMEWVGGNLGSGKTMLYPCSVLRGRGSSSGHLGIAFANKGQIQDVGAKVIHIGEETTSTVLSKGISKSGGQSIYRGLLQINKGAKGAKSNVRCDALILDSESSSDTYPDLRIHEEDVAIGHEASVGKISEEQLYYLRSRGLSEDEALAMIVNGFIEPIIKALPLEYAVEMNRLIEMEMEDSVG